MWNWYFIMFLQFEKKIFCLYNVLVFGATLFSSMNARWKTGCPNIRPKVSEIDTLCGWLPTMAPPPGVSIMWHDIIHCCLQCGISMCNGIKQSGISLEENPHTHTNKHTCIIYAQVDKGHVFPTPTAIRAAGVLSAILFFSLTLGESRWMKNQWIKHVHRVHNTHEKWFQFSRIICDVVYHRK